MKLELADDPVEARDALVAWAAQMPFGGMVLARVQGGEPLWAEVDAALYDPFSSPLGTVGALALLVALEAPGAPSWAEEAVAGATMDAEGRANAWAPLAETALVLQEAMDVDSPLLRVVQDAPSRRIPEEELAAARRGLAAMRRRLWRSRWLESLQSTVAGWARPLHDALASLEGDALPMAAAAGPQSVLARALVAEIGDGEVTLAVLPTGMVLEWTGDGAPPDEIRHQGVSLALDERRSVADRVWLLPEPPEGTLEVFVQGQRHDLRWA